MRKRLFLFILVISFIVSLGLAQSITVTSPHSGDVWYKGHTYTITWGRSGNMNSKVKIRLYQGNTKILGITNSTDNDGSYNWTIPASVPNGTYVIRVKTIDNQVYDDSDSFTIADAPASSGSITITSPTEGACWEKGNTYHIRWTATGSMNLKVKIRLYQGNNKILEITNSTANNGDYTWTVPTTIPDGAYYIRVRTIDNQVYEDGPTFYIRTSCVRRFPGNFIAGMDLVELAIYMHGPGPRIREFEKLKGLLEEKGIKEPVTIKLYQGNREIANLGTFTPTVRSGRVRFNTMPSVMKLNLTPKQRAMMAENPQGFRLVLFSGGKIIGRSPLNVVVSNDNVRKLSGVNYDKLRVIQGARIPNCPDPAVVDIKFSVVRRYSQFRGRVRITGIVKNIGGADYISGPNQQLIVLDAGDAAHPLKVKKFQNLRKGEEVRIVYETDWNSSSPSEGEFPPTFRVYITYDPDINMDSNPKNDDCNLKNNGKSKSGKAINDMLK